MVKTPVLKQQKPPTTEIPFLTERARRKGRVLPPGDS